MTATITTDVQEALETAMADLLDGIEGPAELAARLYARRCFGDRGCATSCPIATYVINALLELGLLEPGMEVEVLDDRVLIDDRERGRIYDVPHSGPIAAFLSRFDETECYPELLTPEVD